MANRIFVIDGREYQDPDPKMTIDDVRQSYITYFPELANAEANTSKRGQDDVTTFTKRVGTKG